MGLQQLCSGAEHPGALLDSCGVTLTSTSPVTVLIKTKMFNLREKRYKYKIKEVEGDM